MSNAKLSPEELRAKLESLPVWPDFREGDPDVDGLIPTCRVESWDKFIEAMRDPQHNRAASEWVYRGQRGGDWPLASTLGRKFDGGSIPADKRQQLLSQFELAMRGRGYDLSAFNGDDAEIEKWAIGQHHGLLTPLLDWTRSPFIALFFAFSSPDDQEKNPSRSVYCVNMSALRNALGEQTLFRDPMGHNNSRLVNQAGLFTMIPDDDDNFASYVINTLQEEGVVSAEPVTQTATVESSGSEVPEVEYTITDNLSDQLKQYIQKIHIPNSGRMDCLATLRKMNIHNGTLFPDAQGASLYCNDWLERILREEKDERARAAERGARMTSTAAAKEAIAAAPDALAAVKAILGQSLGEEFSQQEKDDIAERLYERFQQDQSFDWHLSDSKTAKVKTGQRRLAAAFGFSDTLREQVTDQLVEFYKAAASGVSDA
ncbi:FRG domain-containing protein [Falsirhodobacter algicola]|uniref:FRG domain-containing protein n=1 Tax=Falsirhodobacter algicola TaxID=2692330 RepID=A0A8J8MT88_9RHOB|nr:FRG domain-containing protein [Falsirhodobacter algicola]QUS36272.1 FRG domain-containing protein [Falsirhodobacter algicola]